MKSKLTILITVVFILCPFLLRAYDLTQKFSLEADLGYYGADSIAGSSAYLDPEFLWGFGCKYVFSETFAVGASYLMWDHSDRYLSSGATVPGTTDYLGRGNYELTVKPFSLTAYYYFVTKNERVMPYIGAGATHYTVDYDYHGTGAPGDLTSRSLSGSTWGFHLTAGIEYFTTPEFSIKGEIRYFRGKVDMDVAGKRIDDLTAVWDDDRETVDLSNFYFGIGLTYYFGQPTAELSYY